MIVNKTELEGVLLIKPEIYEDSRGNLSELYNKKEFKKKNINIKFVQDTISVSTKQVLRGIHGDKKTWKLISCLHGCIYVVVVDCRKENFGKWLPFTLSGHNKNQVLVPPGYGLAHLVLSKEAIFHYKQSEYYDRESQFTYRYDDERFNIWWPNISPHLSERDEG